MVNSSKDMSQGLLYVKGVFGHEPDHVSSTIATGPFLFMSN